MRRLEVLLHNERIGAVSLFIESESGAGGEAADGIGDVRRHGGDVIEDEHVVVPGEAEKIALVAGMAADGRRGGIDEGAKHAGEQRFTAGVRALEYEDGVRSGGAERGEKPGEARGLRAESGKGEWLVGGVVIE